MFDAKSILDALMRGGAQPPGQQGGLGSLGDLLRQLQQGDQGPQAGGAPSRTNPANIGPQLGPSRAQEGGSGSPSAAGLEDILRNVMGQGGTMQDVLSRLQQQGGRLGDILGQVLGQAASGVREGATRIDDVTGASRYARDAITQVTGRSQEEILAQLRKLIADNPGAASGAIAGLGALILGTGAGRSLAGSAVKLGSLALIGGLAYKAYQNYQQGRPILGDGKSRPEALLAAPDGSGFEPGTVTHESAMLLIRAMIAAAAADGRIDDKEQQKILAGLKQVELEGGAQEFLTRELNNPATPDELADAVSSPEEGVQVYTAARIAVDPDTEEDHEFLVALATRLGIDQSLAAEIDAAARSVGT